MSEKPSEVPRLLVVSRDSAVLRPIWSMGEVNGWQLELAADPWEAIDRAQSGAAFDLLLLDLPQGSADGLHSLRWLRRLRPSMPIVLIGHSDDNGRKQESIRMGARDYLVRPFDERQLETMIQRNILKASEIVDEEIMSDDVESISKESFFIGVSPVMRKLRAQAALLAEASVPVLILGENGSGKETTARLLHSLSVRSGFEFAKVNCSALPEELLERELFGYERRTAAGPSRVKPGKLELCSKGTILLDEITDMPLRLQSNLLRVLQSKQFIRPNTSDLIEVDTRILATSSMSMEHAVAERKLAEDLYIQLSAYTIHVPSLRDRKEELSFLSRHFMHRLAKHYGLSPRNLSPAIIEAWQAYNWPGNLQELERSVKRYLLVGDDELMLSAASSVSASDSQEAASAKSRNAGQAASFAEQPRKGPSDSKSLRSLVQSVKAEAERSAIAIALEKTGWNRKAAARLLKVSYRTVLYKIEQYKMSASEPSSFPRAKWIPGKENGYRGNGLPKFPERELDVVSATDRRRSEQ